MILSSPHLVLKRNHTMPATTAATVSSAQAHLSSPAFPGVASYLNGALAASTKSARNPARGLVNGHSVAIGNGFANGAACRYSPGSPNSSATSSSAKTTLPGTVSAVSSSNSSASQGATFHTGGHRGSLSNVPPAAIVAATPEKALHYT